MAHTSSSRHIHEGRNVKRFREMLGIKGEALAAELGHDWNLQEVFLLEQKETLDPAILQQVAAALKIPAEAIQYFEEDKSINIISNTVNNSNHASGNSVFSYNTHIHPIEKLVQLHEEKIALYERMLKEKEAMMARLEQLMEWKGKIE